MLGLGAASSVTVALHLVTQSGSIFLPHCIWLVVVSHQKQQNDGELLPRFVVCDTEWKIHLSTGKIV